MVQNARFHLKDQTPHWSSEEVSGLNASKEDLSKEGSACLRLSKGRMKKRNLNSPEMSTNIIKKKLEERWGILEGLIKIMFPLHIKTHSFPDA